MYIDFSIGNILFQKYNINKLNVYIWIVFFVLAIGDHDLNKKRIEKLESL